MLIETLGRAVQRSNLGLGRAMETLWLRPSDRGPIRMPLIAICGAPRTGSTLIYQLLSQAFNVSFISNLQNVLFRTPLLGQVLAARLGGSYVSDYRSAGGFVAGVNGPAEAMHFWRYWCDHQLTDSPPKPHPRRMARLQRVLNAMYRRTQRPLLSGYLPHSFYTTQLGELFPSFLFVRTDRDMLDAAYSALKRWRATAHESLSDDLGYFYGTRPPEVLGEMTHHEYVARQQYFVARQMDKAEERHPERFFHADYAAVCADPRGLVTRLGEALASAGTEVSTRRDIALPEQFRASSYERDKDEDTRRIAVELDRLHSEFGPTGGVYRGA